MESLSEIMSVAHEKQIKSLSSVELLLSVRKSCDQNARAGLSCYLFNVPEVIGVDSPELLNRKSMEDLCEAFCSSAKVSGLFAGVTFSVSRGTPGFISLDW